MFDNIEEFIKNEQFFDVNHIEKVELIKSIILRLTIQYVVSKIDLKELNRQLLLLSNLDLLLKEQVFSYAESKVKYESFLYSHGKTHTKLEEIKKRMKHFITKKNHFFKEN